MLDTPRSLRLRIGIFGRCNSGKSTLMNALVGQKVSIVSEYSGTTTDTVSKSFELVPFGPVVFVDTAGLSDAGSLGQLRMARAEHELSRVDIGLIVVGNDGFGDTEWNIINQLKEHGATPIVVFNRSDEMMHDTDTIQMLHDEEIQTAVVSALNLTGIDALKEMLIERAPACVQEMPRLIGDLLSPEDLVVLVVPLDSGAPAGRLILPQVQTLRDILDAGAVSLTTPDTILMSTLAQLQNLPSLVVCDTQCVHTVAKILPNTVRMTTFSVLMSRFKGDIAAFAWGAGAVMRLKPDDRVLIAESCAHHAQKDDIARVKIPRLLERQAGGRLNVEVLSGENFPQDLTPYTLIVQCGGCMATRREVLIRQYRAKQQQVPMTNYGMAISVVQGVIERVLQCFPEALQAYRAYGH